jgi:adenylate cyclase
VKVEEVARELGVRYVLEGSVRKVGDRIRINAQLIDGEDGSHVWAERFDRDLKDVFALQDEVTKKIVSVLAIKLTTQEQERLVQKVETIPDAYDTLLRALQLHRRFTRDTNIEGRKLFKQAIALDPKYARAYANVALSYSVDIAFGWSTSPDEDIAQALSYADQAFALDETVRQVPFARSTVFMRQGRLDESLTEIRKAIKLDPNYADAYARMGEILVFLGKAEEGKLVIEKSMQLNPHHAFLYKWFLGKALFMLERFEKAAQIFEYVIEQNPEFPGGHLMLAATYGQLGRASDAEWEVSEVLTLLPNLTLANERKRTTYKNAADLERYISGLRKAGIDE